MYSFVESEFLRYYLELSCQRHNTIDTRFYFTLNASLSLNAWLANGLVTGFSLAGSAVQFEQDPSTGLDVEIVTDSLPEDLRISANVRTRNEDSLST